MKTIRFLAHLAIALALLLVAAPAALAGPLLAYAPITIADVDKLWRKAQGPLAIGFNFATPEFKWISRFQQLRELPASLREMTYPTDLRESTNVASPTEGGRAGLPFTVNAVDASVAFVHKNHRFSVSKMARWAGQADGGRGEIMDQLKWEGKKGVEAVARTLGDEFWGSSTGTLATVSVDPGGGATTHTLTLANGYGLAAIIPGTTTAQKRYIVNLFRPNQRIALIRSGAVVANTIAASEAGIVTARDPDAGTIDVTWPGSVDPAAGDQIVSAASANPSTIEHTSHQRHLIGILEMLTAVSVNGIDGSAEENWNPALTDANVGRFDAITWRNGYDEIRNYGREDAVVKTAMDQGVYRDWLLQLGSGVRFGNPMSMEADGEIKARGEQPMQSRRVPPGVVCQWDTQAIKRRSIHDTVTAGGPGWGAAKEPTDDELYLFPIDWVGYLAIQNRKSTTIFYNKQRQAA